MTINKKDRLLISFSGGETSGYMTSLLLKNNHYEETVVLFANTGQESEATLDFVDRCDKHFNFNVVWLETKVFHNERKGSGFTVVNFNSAARQGEPFEEIIKKYGIPNQKQPICTRELKLAPITKYVRSLGWENGSYDTAIGIRLDELDRVSAKFSENRIVYPLIDLKITKQEVRAFWETQPFRLNLHEHEGNCKWCWKKSKRKLLTLAKENPAIFDFPAKMEAMYGNAGFNLDPEYQRVFFRGAKSTKDILAEAELPFEPFVDGYRVTIANFDEDLDSAGACSESCEVF
jgi:3'-phosphoadenosine 5'-phosphosulfate sulfotransferase (PAPS reductase)/FAD synthetase